MSTQERDSDCGHANVKVWRQWESKELGRNGEPRYIIFNARCEHCEETGQGTTSIEAANDVGRSLGVR